MQNHWFRDNSQLTVNKQKSNVKTNRWIEKWTKRAFNYIFDYYFINSIVCALAISNRFLKYSQMQSSDNSIQSKEPGGKNVFVQFVLLCQSICTFLLIDDFNTKEGEEKKKFKKIMNSLFVKVMNSPLSLFAPIQFEVVPTFPPLHT